MTRRLPTNRTIALALAVAIALLAAIRLTTPVAMRSADAPTAEFSGGRAMRDIAVIGRLPHDGWSLAEEQLRQDIRTIQERDDGRTR